MLEQHKTDPNGCEWMAAVVGLDRTPTKRLFVLLEIERNGDPETSHVCLLKQDDSCECCSVINVIK